MYLVSKGVPTADILEAGGTTATRTWPMPHPELMAHHATVVLVTTDPFHEDRSMAIACDLGLMPSPTPTQTSPIRGWSTVPYFLKEAVGVGLGPDHRVQPPGMVARRLSRRVLAVDVVVVVVELGGGAAGSRKVMCTTVP